MSTSSISVQPSLGRRALVRVRSQAWPPLDLTALLAIAAVVYLWSLDRNGFANEYYSAAVRSMAGSWHAFLYGSFDSSGIMTVDKPPLALWVQAMSARLFGFSSWSMLVPQALMGVGSVWLVYDMTRRRFGRIAAFGGGLALALTPITVAISRHNNPDALLVLCITAAVWFLVRGLEDGRSRWLVLSGVCIGLGFEAKMGAALLIVPAIAAAWLWVAPRGRMAALRQLGLAGAAMTVVGLAWPLLMWLTPVANRPWVAGTSDNDIWSLIFGYNGLGRILGQQGAPGGGGPGGGGGAFGGDPGPLRLLNESLGGQGGWLLGFAIVAGLGVAVLSRLRRDDPRTGWVIAIGGSFLTIAVAFSQASGIFHPYYVSELAPFTAALVGAGIGVVVKEGVPARVLGPAAIAAGVATSLAVLGKNPGQLEWLPAILIAVGGLSALALALGPELTRRMRTAALATAMAVLLIAPASWAFQTLGHPTSGTFPAGGPQSAGFGGGPGGRGGGPQGTRPNLQRGIRPGFGNDGPSAAGGAAQGRAGAFGGGGALGRGQSLTEALAYVDQHGGGTLTVSSQTGAASQLITSPADVAGIGGFSGRESQVSIGWLADAVQSGRIRWVLTDGAGRAMPRDSRAGSNDVMAAATKVGTSTSVDGLYDLRGHAADLRALAN